MAFSNTTHLIQVDFELEELLRFIYVKDTMNTNTNPLILRDKGDHRVSLHNAHA